MKDSQQKESGAVLVGMLVVLLAVAGIATVMLKRSARSQAASAASTDRSRSLMVAEAGLNYNFVKMDVDAKYAISEKDPPVTGAYTFAWNPATKEFDSEVLSSSLVPVQPPISQPSDGTAPDSEIASPG